MDRAQLGSFLLPSLDLREWNETHDLLHRRRSARNILERRLHNYAPVTDNDDDVRETIASRNPAMDFSTADANTMGVTASDIEI